MRNLLKIMYFGYFIGSPLANAMISANLADTEVRHFHMLNSDLVCKNNVLKMCLCVESSYVPKQQVRRSLADQN